MERRSLRDISWLVDEPTYREDPALSYSIISRYSKTGFGGLSTLYEKVESPSLALGSIIDCFITDGDKAFQDNYYISDIPSMEPAVEPIVKEVFKRFGNAYTNINDIPDNEIAPIISEYQYQPRWKPETRCKVIREKGQQYYQTMFMAGNKTIVPQDTYNKVFACVRALKDSPQTKLYFQEDNPFDNIERCYQLKFKDEIDGVPYRCMADELVVLHEAKTVIPVDLKTSSKMEYDFYKSFIDWNYSIQARLYWLLIRRAMDRDPYFHDFRLADYRFIVVNTVGEPNPLVWEFDKTKERGDLKIGEHILRDPLNIGGELFHYLQDSPKVPDGITINGVNNIREWLERQ